MDNNPIAGGGDMQQLVAAVAEIVMRMMEEKQNPTIEEQPDMLPGDEPLPAGEEAGLGEEEGPLGPPPGDELPPEELPPEDLPPEEEGALPPEDLPPEEEDEELLQRRSKKHSKNWSLPNMSNDNSPLRYRKERDVAVKYFKKANEMRLEAQEIAEKLNEENEKLRNENKKLRYSQRYSKRVAQAEAVKGEGYNIDPEAEVKNYANLTDKQWVEHLESCKVRKYAKVPTGNVPGLDQAIAERNVISDETGLTEEQREKISFDVREKCLKYAQKGKKLDYRKTLDKAYEKKSSELSADELSDCFED